MVQICTNMILMYDFSRFSSESEVKQARAPAASAPRKAFAMECKCQVKISSTQSLQLNLPDNVQESANQILHVFKLICTKKIQATGMVYGKCRKINDDQCVVSQEYRNSIEFKVGARTQHWQCSFGVHTLLNLPKPSSAIALWHASMPQNYSSESY